MNWQNTYITHFLIVSWLVCLDPTTSGKRQIITPTSENKVQITALYIKKLVLFYYFLLDLLPKHLTGIYRLITDSADITTIINCYCSSFPKSNLSCPDSCFTAVILLWVAPIIVTGAREGQNPTMPCLTTVSCFVRALYGSEEL